MRAEKCPYCRASVTQCKPSRGFMKCASCGGEYHMPAEVFATFPHAGADAKGALVLQAYDDPVAGVCVVTADRNGKYAYCRGYDPATGRAVSCVGASTMGGLAKEADGKLLIDRSGIGDLRELGGSKAKRRGRWHSSICMKSSLHTDSRIIPCLGT